MKNQIKIDKRNQYKRNKGKNYTIKTMEDKNKGVKTAKLLPFRYMRKLPMHISCMFVVPYGFGTGNANTLLNTHIRLFKTAA